MGKNKNSKTERARRCSRMYASLHKDILNSVSEHITVLQFHQNDSDEEVIKDYSTYVKGSFRCYNRACSMDGWRSGKVTILIRKYRDGAYNAVVFKQRCEECDRLGTLNVDKKSYIQRVAYRLLKWAGVALEQPAYRTRKTPPHKAHLCEGCKRGICRDANK